LTLRQFDPKVSYDCTGARKFIGVLFAIGVKQYYAPMSSPKPKHAKISGKALDIYKLDGGKLGVINLNNMIPVLGSVIIDIDIRQEPDIRYRTLLMNQARIIRAEGDKIKKKAQVLYKIVLSGRFPLLNSRCCQYALLEAKCAAYKSF